MIDLIVLVVSVALVDSLNPTTIVPALYLATGPRAVGGILGFAGGVFVVNMLGGTVVLVLGHRFADLAWRPSQNHLHVAELALGLLAIAGSGVLWRRRHRVGVWLEGAESGVHRAAPVAGATIALVELPTAFPYLAVVAAVMTANQSLVTQIMLLVLFNVVFLAPVIAIAVLRAVAGHRAVDLLTVTRSLILRHAGTLVAALVLLIGIALVTLAIVGLVPP